MVLNVGLLNYGKNYNQKYFFFHVYPTVDAH